MEHTGDNTFKVVGREWDKTKSHKPHPSFLEKNFLHGHITLHILDLPDIKKTKKKILSCFYRTCKYKPVPLTSTTFEHKETLKS